jgi:UPF0755 protein
VRKFFIILFSLASLALFIEVGRDLYFLFTPNSQDPSFKILLVEPGSFTKTSELLYTEGLIKNPKRFSLLARVMRLTSEVKVGEYEVQMNMTPFQLLKVITSGKSVLHAVHIPEGFNLDQIADELAEKDLVDREEFIKLARDPRMAHFLGVKETTLEGYLYPETYSFTHFTGERMILKTMVDKFFEVYNREIKFAAEKQSKSLHDIVTLASIIEKETGAPEERPMIASVFYNRLKLNMLLQTDPTVIYGKKGDKKNITRKDLTDANPYNTYVHKGLPIGPISNPGKESLLAAIEPADSKYLYFVSQNNGTHTFSRTYTDHLKAVTKFQLNPKARDGKSWRDLKNRGQAVSPKPSAGIN